jgi:hypothetical protein
MTPCDFFLFPKMKLKPKRRRFDTIQKIQAESQRVLGTLTEKDFQEVSRNGGDGGTSVYMREGTTSRVMAAVRPYGEFFLFLQRQSGIFWIHSYLPQCHIGHSWRFRSSRL